MRLLSFLLVFGLLMTWSVFAQKPELVLPIGHSGGVSSVAFSPNGRYVLSGSGLKLWDVVTGKELRSFDGDSSGVTSVAYSPDGQYILSGSGDRTLKLLEVNTGKQLRSFEGHSGVVRSAIFSPDGRFIVSGSNDNTIRRWQLATGNELATLVAVDSTDWIATTPAGLFDASLGTLKLMYYVINDSTDLDEPWKVIELEQLKQRYYQPGLWSIMMGYSTEPLRQVPAFEGVRLPPSLRLSLKGDQLTIDAKNRKGGIGNVVVFINGAEAIPDLRLNPKQDSIQSSLSLSVNLARFSNRFDTLNLITVVAYNA